jgi:hypothetical protein
LSPQILSIDESSWDHGEEQPIQCRNIFVAIIFLTQLVVIITLAIMAIVAWSNEDIAAHIHWDWGSSSTATSVLLFGITVLASTATLSAIIVLLLLGTLADMMIQISLVLSPISCGLSSLGALMLGQIGPAILFLVVAIMGVCYARSVWHRIPFATANVAVAMAAIHAHKGVIVLAYVTLLQGILWTVVWTLAVVQVSVVHPEWIWECTANPATLLLSSSSSNRDYEYDGDGEDNSDCSLSTQGIWIVIGMALSLYWTSQVIRNVLHTTIAGVVGTFWFVGVPTTTIASENNSNTTIYDSWLRSSVYSLGSICLGSLLVAIIQVLQVLVRLGRQRQQQDQRRQGQQASAMLWCLLECAVDQLERLLEYINSWAFGKSEYRL